VLTGGSARLNASEVVGGVSIRRGAAFTPLEHEMIDDSRTTGAFVLANVEAA
jgi:hypothetical protein